MAPGTKACSVAVMSLWGLAAGFQPSPSLCRGLRPSTALSAAKVFIDGEAGTTGLQVFDRLSSRPDIEILSLPGDKRKDVEARRAAINEADAVILCLPDDAAVAAVGLVAPDNERTVIIDASTAHRVDPAWAYGFAELCPGWREKIAGSKRIANPGCYPTGFIALTRPLVDAGLLSRGAALTVSAVSGYSGGGKALMGVYEGETHEPWGAYGLGLGHKHLGEMAEFSSLGVKPVFAPAVGDFAQGMVVTVPLHYSQCQNSPRQVTGARLRDALKAHYEGEAFVEVMGAGEGDGPDPATLERGAFLRPDTLNDSNRLQLFVFADDTAGQALLVARLDNLGKGASGAAVQNLNLALGLGESTGL